MMICSQYRIISGILFVQLTISLASSCKESHAEDALRAKHSAREVLTGSEQATVEAIVTEADAPEDKAFANAADELFAVLLERRYPQPDAQTLAADAIDVLSDECRRKTGKPISDSQRASWQATVARQRSFEGIFKALRMRPPNSFDRKSAIDAALKGLIGGAACRSRSLWMKCKLSN